MRTGNGTLKIIGAFVGMAAVFVTLLLTIRSADVGAIDKHITISAKLDAAQDTSIARLNSETARDRGELRSEMKDTRRDIVTALALIELLLDEKKIPVARRVHAIVRATRARDLDTTTAKDTTGGH